MRTFLAAPVPEAIRARALEALGPLRARAPKVRWTPAERWHLTLKFLGELPEEKVQALASTLDDRLGGEPVVTLETEGLRLFPRPRRPRVVALAFARPSPEVLALHRRLEALAAGVGVAPETRPFRPHLTLGRIKYPGDARPLEGLGEDAGEPWPAFPLERVQLFSSVLSRGGPTYTLLGEITLEGASA